MPKVVFKKGHKKTAGRPKGVPNHTTRVLKEAILTAAESVGENGRGKNGLTGYMRRLALREAKAFSVLLGKILPTQITGTLDGTLNVIHQGMSNQEAALAYLETLKADPKLLPPPVKLKVVGE